MNQHELERAIRALADNLVDGVIRAILSLPVQDLARPARESEARATTTAPGRPLPARAKVLAGGTRSVRGRGANTGGSERVDPLRAETLSILRSATSALSVTEIRAQLSQAVPRKALTKVLLALCDSGSVTKQGRGRVVYQVTAVGRRAGG
jgi:hypothetical protein